MTFRTVIAAATAGLVLALPAAASADEDPAVIERGGQEESSFTVRDSSDTISPGVADLDEDSFNAGAPQRGIDGELRDPTDARRLDEDNFGGLPDTEFNPSLDPQALEDLPTAAGTAPVPDVHDAPDSFFSPVEREAVRRFYGLGEWSEGTERPVPPALAEALPPRDPRFERVIVEGALVLREADSGRVVDVIILPGGGS